MSDMADQYHHVSVFDNSPQKLVCTQHVDRAWRGALQQNVKGLRGKLLRFLSEELAVDKLITLIGKVHIMIFNELIAVKHIHIHTYLDWYTESFHIHVHN